LATTAPLQYRSPTSTPEKAGLDCELEFHPNPSTAQATLITPNHNPTLCWGHHFGNCSAMPLPNNLQANAQFANFGTALRI